MSTLAATAAPMLMGIVIAGAFSLALSFSLFRQARYLWLISFLGAAVYYSRAFIGFLAVIGLAYAGLRLLNRQASRSDRWRWACVALFSIVVVFTLGRVLHWERLVLWPGRLPLAVYSLDMWLALRLVTLFWEVGSSAIPVPSLSRYVLWACLPLTLSGPLIRYSQFPGVLPVNGSLWRSGSWWIGVAEGMAKLFAGLALSAGQQALATHWPNAHFFNNGVGTLLTGPIGFYLTSAGYFQIMEELGKPCGFKVPVSFNFPIGRENISAFWMNWNMTATYVFRDYLFYNRWGLHTYNIYSNTIVLFVLVGLWHDANAYWLLWGFLHGVLFCIFLLYRKYGQNFTHVPLRGTAIARTGSRALTYLCVCACWYLPSKILQKLASA